MKKLHSLIPKEIIDKYKIKNLSTKGITCDSRKVKKGYIFAVLIGSNKNGLHYVNEAIRKGAVALLIDEKNLKQVKHNIKILIIPSLIPRKMYAQICNKFYSYKFDNIIAITGTNGKTSVAWFANNLIKILGINSASIGTLGVHHKSLSKLNNLTTPESEVLIATLIKLYNKKVKNIIIEASSHGLDQYRLDGINFNIVVITSLSRDHLDYHKNFKNYKRAKLRLFYELANKGVAIINECVPKYKDFIEAAKINNLKIITIGNSKSSNWKFKIINIHRAKQEIEVSYNNKKTVIFSKLIGEHQINNLITSISILIEMGFKRQTVEDVIGKLKPPPGRLELIKDNNDKKIYVDFAHTPDALKNVLLSIRPYVNKKLYLILGCGGDRDKGKRALMGKIANNYADKIIVTDDNPRYENPTSIRKQIIDFCPNSTEIAGRGDAIKYSINNLQKGDVLLIVGKGHENYQEINGKFLKFSDKKIIKTVIGVNSFYA